MFWYWLMKLTGQVPFPLNEAQNNRAQVLASVFRFNFGKRFSIHWPWSSGLGTLGLKLGDDYGDIHIKSRRLYLFTSKHVNNALTGRSWYVLTLRGWKLLKREDQWGTWQRGHRRPPLYDLPEQGIPQRAWELRDEFPCYKIIDWYGEQLELISWPSPERMSVNIMMRKPGDPTTLREVILEEYLPELGPISFDPA